MSVKRKPCPQGKAVNLRVTISNSCLTGSLSQRHVGKGHALSGVLATASTQKTHHFPQIVYDLRRKGHALSLHSVACICPMNRDLTAIS